MSIKQHEPVESKEGVHSGEEREESKSRELTRLALVGIAALISWIGIWRALTPIDFIAIAATLVGGYPVYKETFLALRHGRVNMEVSMAVAIFASLLVGQFTVSVVITFFVLLSEYIETYAVDRGRQTIRLLERSAPKKALIKKSRDGSEELVNTDSLRQNDI